MGHKVRFFYNVTAYVFVLSVCWCSIVKYWCALLFCQSRKRERERERDEEEATSLRILCTHEIYSFVLSKNTDTLHHKIRNKHQQTILYTKTHNKQIINNTNTISVLTRTIRRSRRLRLTQGMPSPPHWIPTQTPRPPGCQGNSSSMRGMSRLQS